MESVGAPRRKPRTTEQMPPPVLALAVERVVEAGGGAGYLISVISQFETGLDLSPVWRGGGGRRSPRGSTATTSRASSAATCTRSRCS